MSTTMFKSLSLCAVFLAMPVVAFAQTQNGPVIFAGAVVKYSEDSITLKDRNGKEVVVAMASGWTISRPRTLDNSALKVGDYIASANTPIDDHTGKSSELRIMEPGYVPEHGTPGEGPGTRADGAPVVPMTFPQAHGHVTNFTKTPAGVELDVNDADGSRHLIVPNDVKVTAFELLNRTALQTGIKVEAKARKDVDGVLRASRVTVVP